MDPETHQFRLTVVHQPMGNFLNRSGEERTQQGLWLIDLHGTAASSDPKALVRPRTSDVQVQSWCCRRRVQPGGQHGSKS